MLALPIVPGRYQPSIFSADELNFRVRNGNGCTLTAINTNCRFFLGPHQYITGFIKNQGDFLNISCFFVPAAVFMPYNRKDCRKNEKYTSRKHRKSKNREKKSQGPDYHHDKSGSKTDNAGDQFCFCLPGQSPCCGIRVL